MSCERGEHSNFHPRWSIEKAASRDRRGHNLASAKRAGSEPPNRNNVEVSSSVPTPPPFSQRQIIRRSPEIWRYRRATRTFALRLMRPFAPASAPRPHRIQTEPLAHAQLAADGAILGPTRLWPLACLDHVVINPARASTLWLLQTRLPGRDTESTQTRGASAPGRSPCQIPLAPLSRPASWPSQFHV